MLLSTGARTSALASLLLFGACLSGEDTANQIGPSSGDPAAAEAGQGGGGGGGGGFSIDIKDRFRISKLTADEPGVARFTDRSLVDPWGLVSLQNTFFMAAKETGELVDVAANGRPRAAEIKLVRGITGATVVRSNRIRMDIGGKRGSARILVASQTGEIFGVNPEMSTKKGSALVDLSKSNAQFTDVAVLEQIRGGSGSCDDDDGYGWDGGYGDDDHGDDGQTCDGHDDGWDNYGDDGKDDGKDDGDDGCARARRMIVLAADFHNGKIVAFVPSNNRLRQIDLGQRFETPEIAKSLGLSPFGVMTSGNRVFVTWAKRAAPEKGEKFDDQQPGFGALASFDRNGKLLHVTKDGLNVAWGMVMSRSRRAGSVLLVANHVEDGNKPGQIRAFDPENLQFLGKLQDGRNRPIAVDGLWDLNFGFDIRAETADQLHLTAGPNDGKDGLFARLEQRARGGKEPVEPGEPAEPTDPADPE